MAIQPWQERVVEEKTDLDDKYDRLVAFMCTEEFKAVTPEEKARLHFQAMLMEAYMGVLEDRIEAFV